MKYLKYFTQFVCVILSFSIFKLLGPKLSSSVSGKIFEKIGPLFRSKKIIHSNIRKALPNINFENEKKLINSMWNNYGRVFAEYMFIENFRKGNLATNINIEGQVILNDIRKNNKQVIFISGHLSNFELMAMCLEKNDINLAAIYRPLNNIFLNPLMERIRKKYICKNQIRKGIGGMKKLIKLKKKNFSTALMIDQRVSEGIQSNFFGEKASTTTIPAQIVKKYKIPVVPIFIERFDDIKFKMTINKPINFDENKSVEEITNELNKLLENMILNKPNYWIWSHNRWK